MKSLSRARKDLLEDGTDWFHNMSRLTLTLRCVHDANQMGSLISAISNCKALKHLRLDLDTTINSGGVADILWRWFRLTLAVCSQPAVALRLPSNDAAEVKC